VIKAVDFHNAIQVWFQQIPVWGIVTAKTAAKSNTNVNFNNAKDIFQFNKYYAEVVSFLKTNLNHTEILCT